MTRPLAEESLVLDVWFFTRQSLGCPAYWTYGYLPWGEGKIGPFSWLLAQDTLTLYWHDGSSRSDTFSLTSTPAHLGGERAWFLCPVCKGRVRKLYMPAGYRSFGCRTCLDVSYESQRRSSDWVSAPERRLRLPQPVNKLRQRSPSERRALREAERLLEELQKTNSLADQPLPVPPDAWPFAGKRPPQVPVGTTSPPAAPPKRPRGRPREKRPYQRHKPLPISARTSESEGYCVKCRDWREMEDPQPVTFANGRPALQGTCPMCHTMLARILAGK